MTAAAKLLQSCPTLCDPRDGSPPGSPVPGILQARTLDNNKKRNTRPTTTPAPRRDLSVSSPATGLTEVLFTAPPRAGQLDPTAGRGPFWRKMFLWSLQRRPLEENSTNAGSASPEPLILQDHYCGCHFISLQAHILHQLTCGPPGPSPSCPVSSP